MIGRYTVIPKHCLDIWSESVGVGKLQEDVGDVLSEDVTYRIREAVHNAMKFMKQCKRSCLTIDDFNNALKESNVEPILGHGGPDNLTFKAVPLKEGRLCYVDEKELNLRDTALDTIYPADPGETSLKDKLRNDEKKIVDEPLQNYFNKITKALLGKSDNVRKVALEELSGNRKISVLLPNLVSFISNQVKQHTKKDSFGEISSHLLQTINALTFNKSALLTPYVFQLVKIMLFIVTDAKIPVSQWHVKDKAAYVVARLCRKYNNMISNLMHQLLKSYQDNLNKFSQSMGSLYGSVAGIRILGPEAVRVALLPVVSDKLLQLEERLIHRRISGVKEVINILSVICSATRLLYTEKSSFTKNNHTTVYSKLYGLCPNISMTHSFPVGSSYYEASPSDKNDIKVSQLVKFVRSSSTTSERINKELEKLKKSVKQNEDEVMENLNSFQTNLGVITERKRLERRKFTPWILDHLTVTKRNKEKEIFKWQRSSQKSWSSGKIKNITKTRSTAPYYDITSLFL